MFVNHCIVWTKEIDNVNKGLSSGLKSGDWLDYSKIAMLIWLLAVGRPHAELNPSISSNLSNSKRASLEICHSLMANPVSVVRPVQR